MNIRRLDGHNRSDQELDAALNALPRDIEPNRDLWPDIHARIKTMPTPLRSRALRTQWRWAAGFAVTALATLTLVAIRQWPLTQMTAEQREHSVGETQSDANAVLGEYLRARAELDRQLLERIALLPADARANLAAELAIVQRAADDVLAQMTSHPADPLLHELMLSTHRAEARLLATASDLSRFTSNEASL